MKKKGERGEGVRERRQNETAWIQPHEIHVWLMCKVICFADKHLALAISNGV